MLFRAGLTITLLLTGVCLQAQNPSNPRSLAGNSSLSHCQITVRMANGDPAPNARVDLRDLSRGVAAITGYTNGSGVADISNVPNGNYDVVVTYKLAEVDQHTTVSFGEHSLTMTLPVDRTGSDIGNLSSVSVAAYKVPDKARKEYKKAEEALNNQKYDESLARLEKALAIYPAYADALTLRGIIRMDKQDKDGALADLDAAIKADSSCPMAYFAMGATLNSLNRFDEAVASLNRGLTLDPKSWQGYFELGKALVGKGDYKAGIEQLEKAQGMASRVYPPIHLVKAHAMLAVKEYPSAMKELQAFLSEAPNDKRSVEAKETLDKVSAFIQRDSLAQK